ncbi:MAG: hypothetical protein ACREGA_01475 [Candidatus Saccharimonadales bacterium]
MKHFWPRKLGLPPAVVGLAALLLLIIGLMQLINRPGHLVKRPGQATGAAGAQAKTSQQKAAKLKAKQPFQFPAGGRVILPYYRLVALYGTPNIPALGALGQQSLPATIKRVKAMAANYQTYSRQPILPTLEIIATVASDAPTANHDYSREVPLKQLQPWLSAARLSGVYVVLDLQPGRNNFLAQAKEYASLLKQPNVGLALDPEWKLTAKQVPLKQIGTVDISKINQTAAWLAHLTTQNHLPQKLFLLQQFWPDMIRGRQALDVDHSSLANVIQMDGSGTQAQKLQTWQTIKAAAPGNTLFGWKNFFVVDHPTLTPAQTMQLSPQPFYISYQ